MRGVDAGSEGRIRRSAEKCYIIEECYIMKI
jgi:hypothetical protein